MTATLAIPQPTSLADVQDTVAAIREWVPQCDSIPPLNEMRNRSEAMAQYWSKTHSDGVSEWQAAIRVIERRIGELLPAERDGQGQRTDLGLRNHDDEVPFHRQQQSDFRQMAAHPDIVDDVLEQSSDEDPPSRRKVVETIKERTQRRPIEEWTPDEIDLKRRLDEGDTVVVSMRSHPHLIQWATDAGRYERVDRRTAWGNPFEMPGDGDRQTVIRNYAEHYLPYKPSLIDRLGGLQGKALGCWCAPEPCHGDVLKREVDG